MLKIKDRKIKIGIDKIKISKPEMKPGESESEWMSRCVPFLIENEGKTREQAVGQCRGMFQNKSVEKFEIAIDKMESSTFVAPEDFEIDGVEIKKGQELHSVLGVVLEPETVDATVTEKTIGDIYSEEEVQKAAYYFLANYGGAGNDLMHDGNPRRDAVIVESYVTPVKMQLGSEEIKKGTWLMRSLILNERIWKAIKAGDITGYSIGGVTNAKFEEAV